MIVTTTNNIPGMEVTEYKGLVTGEVVAGINFLKDIGAGFRNFFGGRSEGYEEEFLKAKEQAMIEIKDNAFKIGANAIIGLKFDISVIGSNSTGNMVVVTFIGTAVTAQ